LSSMVCPLKRGEVAAREEVMEAMENAARVKSSGVFIAGAKSIMSLAKFGERKLRALDMARDCR
jgi:hypothetical protein